MTSPQQQQAQILQLLKYFNYGMITFGLVGNSLSFVIFARSSKFAKSSIGIYYKYMAIFDNFNAIYLLIVIASTLASNGHQHQQHELHHQSRITCKLFYYMSASLGKIPSWLQALFAIDQCLDSNKRNLIMKKLKSQISLILAIITSHLVIYVPMLFIMDVYQYSAFHHQHVLANNTRVDVMISSSVCGLAKKSYPLTSKIMPIMALIDGSLVPFLIMMITTGLIMRSLIVSRKNVESNGIRATTTTTTVFSDSIINRNRRNTSLISRNRNVKREFKFGVNAMVLNVLFILLTAPINLAYIVPIGGEHAKLVQAIFLLLYYTNYSTRFLTSFCVNSIFRNECLVLLRIRSDNSH